MATWTGAPQHIITHDTDAKMLLARIAETLQRIDSKLDAMLGARVRIDRDIGAESDAVR